MDDELKYMLMKVLYKLDELLKEMQEKKNMFPPYAPPEHERWDEQYCRSPMPWLNQTICSTDAGLENPTPIPQTSTPGHWSGQPLCATSTIIPPVTNTDVRIQ